jgi:uncharacterized membrane protein
MENELQQADSVQEATDDAAALGTGARERAEHQVWLLKRHSTCTSGQLALAYGVVAGLIVGAAALYALAGEWLVLPVAIVETLAVGGFCWFYTRRGRGYDSIELYDGELIVVRSDGNWVERAELNPLWAKVALGTGRNPKIEILYAGETAAVGAQVPIEDRKRAVVEINQALSALRVSAAR